MRIKTFLLLGTLFLLLQFASRAQMLDPAIDRAGEPFSYFSKPTDVLGVMDGRWGTLVSPEGFLYTGYGELMFFAGNPARPIEQRVKTLLRGYLPVIQFTYADAGIRYSFTMFAATLDGNPESPLVNFVRVTVGNTSTTRRVAYLSVAARYQPESNLPGGTGDNRFRRPAKSPHPGGYEQAGVQFNPEWTYGFSNDAFLRDSKIFYLYPSFPEPARFATLKDDDPTKPDSQPHKLHVLPTTPVGIAKYKLPLAGGEETTLTFRMPYAPLDGDDPYVVQLRAATFDDYLQRTMDFWDKIFARGIDISLPENKVTDSFKVNLVYDLIARDKVGEDYIQTVNKFHYHAFWLRDSSYIVRMYDLSGYHDIARQDLDFFARWQQPDGNFVSQGGQFDGWGQTMWAYGEHYRITHDAAFAAHVYPSVQRAVTWLIAARISDPLKLVPATTPGDNEDISGHVTGHNFWALTGLKNAIAMADGLGHKDDADAWRREYSDFLAALVLQLDKITASTGGYIPPGLDASGGQDWGNMLSVYPEVILDPHDPKVTATLRATRSKYQEGIMTYGDGRWLHHYLTMKNTETEVIRGDEQTALEELYAILLHTSSTHAGFEYDVIPWGTRDFGQNLAPHGWFAAKYRALLRNMLVREQGDDLHLLSVISPAWVVAGKEISVRRAPTNFGQVNFSLRFVSTNHAVLSLENHFSDGPAKLVLHLPWFMNVTNITADGKPLQIVGDQVGLPITTRDVQISWSKKPNISQFSFDHSVAVYKVKYRRRYESFFRDGNNVVN
ncbi:MAG: hypothetical protein WAM91_10595 [Candidatus Acidiferrales bacterium]